MTSTVSPEEQARRDAVLAEQARQDQYIRNRKQFCDDPKRGVQYPPGSPAVYDSMTGLVPVKVLEVRGECYGFSYDQDSGVLIKWPKGHTSWEFPSRVIPRKQLRKSEFHIKVDSNYKWVTPSTFTQNT